MDSKTSEIQGRVWYELKLSTTFCYYIEDLIDKNVRKDIIYNASIAGFSLVGAVIAVIFFLMENPPVWLIAISIIFLIAPFFIVSVNQFKPLFIIPYSSLSELSKLYAVFTTYTDELHNIFGEIRRNEITPKKAGEKLLEINNKYSTHKINAGRIFGKMDKKIEAEAQKRSEEYLNSIYGD